MFNHVSAHLRCHSWSLVPNVDRCLAPFIHFLLRGARHTHGDVRWKPRIAPRIAACVLPTIIRKRLRFLRCQRVKERSNPIGVCHNDWWRQKNLGTGGNASKGKRNTVVFYVFLIQPVRYGKGDLIERINYWQLAKLPPYTYTTTLLLFLDADRFKRMAAPRSNVLTISVFQLQIMNYGTVLRHRNQFKMSRHSSFLAFYICYKQHSWFYDGN